MPQHRSSAGPLSPPQRRADATHRVTVVRVQAWSVLRWGCAAWKADTRQARVGLPGPVSKAGPSRPEAPQGAQEQVSGMSPRAGVAPGHSPTSHTSEGSMNQAGPIRYTWAWRRLRVEVSWSRDWWGSHTEKGWRRNWLLIATYPDLPAHRMALVLVWRAALWVAWRKSV